MQSLQNSPERAIEFTFCSFIPAICHVASNRQPRTRTLELDNRLGVHDGGI